MRSIAPHFQPASHRPRELLSAFPEHCVFVGDRL